MNSFSLLILVVLSYFTLNLLILHLQQRRPAEIDVRSDALGLIGKKETHHSNFEPDIKATLKLGNLSLPQLNKVLTDDGVNVKSQLFTKDNMTEKHTLLKDSMAIEDKLTNKNYTFNNNLAEINATTDLPMHSSVNDELLHNHQNSLNATKNPLGPHQGVLPVEGISRIQKQHMAANALQRNFHTRQNKFQQGPVHQFHQQGPVQFHQQTLAPSKAPIQHRAKYGKWSFTQFNYF